MCAMSSNDSFWYLTFFSTKFHFLSLCSFTGSPGSAESLYQLLHSWSNKINLIVWRFNHLLFTHFHRSLLNMFMWSTKQIPEISDLLPCNFSATSKTEENFLKILNVFWSSVNSVWKSRVRNHSGNLLLPGWVVLKSPSQPPKASLFYFIFSSERCPHFS